MIRKARQEAAGQQRIGPGFSIYLDLVRVVAALDVMVAHAQLSGLVPPLPFILDSAPTAVIVFFVLSGYIIESTTSRGGGWRPYAVHRIARITSVAWPAIILSVACAVGFALWSGAEATARFMAEWGQWWRLPAILLFRGQDWFREVALPWNGPYWSLHFEVAYYLIYGFLLLPAAWARWLSVLVVALLAGPKILLLFPCWWLGVELARRPALAFPGRKTALAVLLATPVIIATMVHYKAGPAFNYAMEARHAWYHLLGHAEPFPVRYVAAILVGANFVAARQLENMLVKAFSGIGSFIRWIAGYTFSIYLYHRPLQHLAGRFYRAATGSFAVGALVELGILSAILFLGHFTERRTGQWRQVVSRWLGGQAGAVMSLKLTKN